MWRSSSVERRVFVPWLSRRDALSEETPPQSAPPRVQQDATDRSFLYATAPRLGWLNLNILDWYVTRVYLGIVGLSFVGLLGIFYISTFIDLSDKLFKGQTSGQRLLEYFWFATPQFAYYVLPIAALVASLVTVGLLTKTSELTVMKACGISLYRAALPIFVLSLAWSAILFGVGESVLARANRRAEALNKEIRSGVAQTTTFMDRQWVVSEAGSIYHYLSFDPNLDEFGSFSAYDFEGRPWTLARRTFSAHAEFDEEAGHWEGHDVWVRDVEAGVEDDQSLESDGTRTLAFLEPPDFFETEPPDAELMNRPGARRLRRGAERQWLRCRAARRGAPPQGVVPVRHARVDADCRAVRGHHGTSRRAVWRRGRDFSGLRLLDHHERVRSDRERGDAGSSPRRLGPQSPLRGLGHLPAPDRQDLKALHRTPSSLEGSAQRSRRGRVILIVPTLPLSELTRSATRSRLSTDRSKSGAASPMGRSRSNGITTRRATSST